MSISKEQYGKMVSESSPKSPILKDCILAFLSGGLICCFGQLLQNFYTATTLQLQDAKTMVSVTLIFIAAVLTSTGVFDKIAKHAGAGTLVPITGFANAVISPAIEFKSEGWILGLGANVFKIAGPVIVYGVSASVVYGFIYWICTMI